MIAEEESIFTLIVTALLLGLFIIVGVYAHNRNKEDKSTREFLVNNGYTEVQVGAHESCNTAEILAIKRCDIKYGPGNYTFTSTNFNRSVWYKAEKK